MLYQRARLRRVSSIRVKPSAIATRGTPPRSSSSTRMASRLVARFAGTSITDGSAERANCSHLVEPIGGTGELSRDFDALEGNLGFHSCVGSCVGQGCCRKGGEPKSRGPSTNQGSWPGSEPPPRLTICPAGTTARCPRQRPRQRAVPLSRPMRSALSRQNGLHRKSTPPDPSLSWSRRMSEP